MKKENDEAIEEMLRGFQYLLERLQAKTTRIENGIVVSQAQGDAWNIRFNGSVVPISVFGKRPEINANVKVYIPQGNLNLAYFVTE